MKKFLITVLTATILLNILAVFGPGFADAYSAYVFPIWVGTLGRLTSLAPISVGEIMILVGVFWIFIFALGLCAILINRNKTFRSVYFGYCKATAGLLIIIFLIMTLNCFINYRTTPIAEDSFEAREFSVSELAELRDFIVNKCNELAQEMDRDEEGNVIYLSENGASLTESDMKVVAADSMRGISGRFPKLSGFYVTPKPLYFSGFVSQQYMQGYYFPFSMEANYNTIMYITNKPFTMCHELSHTRSYIMEDEANFLAYLACTESEDKLFKYSGYMGVLNYVNNAFYENVSKEEYKSHVKLSELVRHDNIFLAKEDWEKVEDESVLKTETVKKAADTFVDTTLKANGIDDGKASYNRVVELMLLDYYE
ncbi:DUF3810 domain-containing protein [Butyrivibrio sp. WCD3002]|uniref:DUF3810 domain-containing protein n=1 Tax=Butyrivibrio sp. WCD3002 TaxID=1280676 RepID=UPI000421E7B0|nr:DUF3810 domain-containing protein [Butyrivibrio sp. WCD3002]